MANYKITKGRGIREFPYDYAIEVRGHIIWSDSFPEVLGEKQVLKACVNSKFEGSWDDGVETYEDLFGQNFWTELYWYAYKYIENNDVDGGVCGQLRQDAVGHIIKSMK